MWSEGNCVSQLDNRWMNKAKTMYSNSVGHICWQMHFICQIPKLTLFWWESSIWNTSHQHHSWHSRVKLITSDTCASSQSGRLICIEEHSAEVIDAHTKYGHPMTPAPISKSLLVPKAPTAQPCMEEQTQVVRAHQTATKHRNMNGKHYNDGLDTGQWDRH